MSDETARSDYLAQWSESKYWTVYFENMDSGNRYNLLIEYDEADYEREHNVTTPTREKKKWWEFWKLLFGRNQATSLSSTGTGSAQETQEINERQIFSDWEILLESSCRTASKEMGITVNEEFIRMAINVAAEKVAKIHGIPLGTMLAIIEKYHKTLKR